MTFIVVRTPKPSRKALSGMVGVLLIALVAAVLVGMPSGDVPPVWAALCQSSHGCGYGYLHAVMNVTHVDTSHVPQPVRSDTGESLKITAYWNTSIPPCQEYSEYATAGFDHSGGSFVLSNVDPSTHITALYLCSGPDSCSEEFDYTYNYKIIAKVDDPLNLGGVADYNLRQAVFETTSVDDGLLVDYDTCTTGSSVSPTFQTFSQTDSGAFECAIWPDCTATGPALQLTYE